MNDIPTVTAESYAKSLGANTKFLRHETLAYNFPTREAASLFYNWLKDRNYTVKIDAGRNIEVSYSAPIACSNVIRLARNER